MGIGYVFENVLRRLKFFLMHRAMPMRSFFFDETLAKAFRNHKLVAIGIMPFLLTSVRILGGGIAVFFLVLVLGPQALSGDKCQDGEDNEKCKC